MVPKVLSGKSLDLERPSARKGVRQSRPKVRDGRQRAPGRTSVSSDHQSGAAVNRKRMFNFFRHKNPVLESFDFLQTDIHSHLIPGIDDGVPDVETSIARIKDLQSMGFQALITTPHIMTDLYPNTPEIICSGLATVQQALEAEGIDMPITAAAEYLLDESFAEKLNKGELLTLGDQYVLVEMSFISPPPNANELLFQLQTKGYRPILAHPERYGYLRGDQDLKQYERLKERGCLLQLNLLSLVGYYGPDVKKRAIRMIEADLFDLAGTDLHNERHAQGLRELLEDYRATKLLADHEWRNAEVFGG